LIQGVLAGTAVDHDPSRPEELIPEREPALIHRGHGTVREPWITGRGKRLGVQGIVGSPHFQLDVFHAHAPEGVQELLLDEGDPAPEVVDTLITGADAPFEIVEHREDFQQKFPFGQIHGYLDVPIGAVAIVREISQQTMVLVQVLGLSLLQFVDAIPGFEESPLKFFIEQGRELIALTGGFMDGGLREFVRRFVGESLEILDRLGFIQREIDGEVVLPLRGLFIRVIGSWIQWISHGRRG
jgi:hypothetical protein